MRAIRVAIAGAYWATAPPCALYDSRLAFRNKPRDRGNRSEVRKHYLRIRYLSAQHRLHESDQLQHLERIDHAILEQPSVDRDSVGDFRSGESFTRELQETPLEFRRRQH